MVVPMEDHSQAYFVWKEQGYQQAWCWHVDAHLDIGQDGLGADRLKALAACNRIEELDQRGNSYLPWGGLHCGNYLYPAILEGIVARLTWVIPPDLPTESLLNWSREHLEGWFDLTLQEYASLEEREGWVEGEILGIPFALGTLDCLPRPDEEVLLDLDLDYFLTEEGELWGDCEQLSGQLKTLPAGLTTVAYSVCGGYTPDQHRSLAAPFLKNWEGYRATDLDKAAALVRNHHYREAIPLLRGRLSQEFVEAYYLLGTCYHHLKQFPQALECWNILLDSERLPPDGEAYLAGLCAELLCHDAQPDQALEFLQRAQRLAGEDYRLYWLKSQALEVKGDLRTATRAARRAVRLAEGRLCSLQMRLALARLYRRQGKHGLAQAEKLQVERMDVTGELRPLTLLR